MGQPIVCFTQRGRLEPSSESIRSTSLITCLITLIDKVKNLPEHSTNSKKEFVLSRLICAAKHYLWFDLAYFYVRHDPGFQSSAAFTSQMLARRVLGCAVYLVFQYSMGVVVHSLIVALIVSCTSSEPSSWPNVFGKWEDAYTIRRFWGYVILQCVRVLCSNVFFWRTVELGTNFFDV